MGDIDEKDWKLFRSRIAQWQTDYMDRLNHEYIELLTSDKDPVDKFWELDEAIRKAKKSPGVQIQMRRSTCKLDLLRLLFDGAIGLEDLEGFSEDLQEAVKTFYEEYGENRKE